MDEAVRASGASIGGSNGGVNNNYHQANVGRLSDYKDRKAAVEAEMTRVHSLPSNSNYAVHRIRVLNKILHLLSVPRTMSEEEELELLLAGLSL